MENVAILTYLAKQFPDARLLPQDLSEEARCISTMAWFASARSVDRSSGSGSRLVDGNSLVLPSSTETARVGLSAGARPEISFTLSSASSALAASAGVWCSNGKHDCGIGFHPSRRSRLRIAISDTPSLPRSRDCSSLSFSDAESFGRVPAPYGSRSERPRAVPQPVPKQRSLQPQSAPGNDACFVRSSRTIARSRFGSHIPIHTT